MSRRLPATTPKKVLRALLKAHFYVHHVTGSHYALRHLVDPSIRVTVPYHNKDIPPGILRAVINQAGLTTDEFLDLL